MNPRIIPLNLPAGLEHETPGNPVTTRLESAVGNCYPGLEMDIRNLDRRFFPGLIFEFVSFPNGSPAVFGRGAKLVDVDSSDPDLPQNNATLPKQLTELANIIGKTAVFLDAFTVKSGKRIELYDRDGVPYDWDVTWRLVRSMEARPVTIELASRDGSTRSPLMALTAKRRTYWNERGEFSDAYQPGELSQSLCSPWQHDFRDCSCTYWASNHPDIVLPAHPATPEETQSPGIAAERADDPIVWMRWNQSRDEAARATRDSCRPFEMDHFEINDRWHDLAVVLADRERLTPWSIGPCEEAASLDPILLESELKRLAGVEHALALEYLYARYSVRFDDADLDTEDQSHADFIAHELLLIAIGEMTHLRWVNQLLLELSGERAIHSPVLDIAEEVPGLSQGKVKRRGKFPKVGMRPPKMRAIYSAKGDSAIDDFVAAESPSGTIEGQYAKILALLRQGLPPRAVSTSGADDSGQQEKHRPIHREYHGRTDFSPDVIGLVERIIADGVTHYSRFREIKALLERPREKPLVRELKNITRKTKLITVKSSTGESQEIGYATFVGLYTKLISALHKAYSGGLAEDRTEVVQARQAMIELDFLATQLAVKGLAVPLLEIGRDVLRNLKQKSSRVRDE